MFVIRPITAEDLKTIERLMSDDLIGITSLPRNKHFLKQKLESSLASFTRTISSPKNELHFFVLENIETGEIGGICGLESKDAKTPCYSYKLEKILPPETRLAVPRKQQTLRLYREEEPTSEICSLYILPSFRKEGLGRLLSLSRFLFIANFPERFNEKIFAEMRGFIDDKNTSPFWDGLGKHFLNIEFEELMNILEEVKESIPLVVPQYPIYVTLLNDEAQDAIGRVHLDTQPALNLLMREGFSLTDEIDLFDGGPKIEAVTSEIRTIQNSRLSVVQEVSELLSDSENFMISNTRLDFSACYGDLKIIDDQTVFITSDVARALTVRKGDMIRYAQPSARSKILAAVK